MADSLEDKVKGAYRRHFEDTKNWAEAWNRTLADVVGNYDPEAPEEQHELRQRVVQILTKVRRDVEVDAGDPYALAMRAAMQELKKDKVVEVARRAYSEEIGAIKKELLKKQRPKGPKDWRPRGRLKDPNEAVEDEMEKSFEQDPFDLSLKIGFDGKGGLIGWRIGFPSENPVAYHQAILTISDQTDYDDIERAIDEAFESIDWNEVKRELEEGDGA